MIEVGISSHGANVRQARFLLKVQSWVRMRVKGSHNQKFAALASGVWRNDDLILLAARPALHSQRTIGISQYKAAFLVSILRAGLGILPRLAKQSADEIVIKGAHNLSSDALNLMIG